MTSNDDYPKVGSMEELAKLSTIWQYVNGSGFDTGKPIKGEDGKSAYQIWLDNGGKGTEKDFLNSLKADVGDFQINSGGDLLYTEKE